MLEAILSQADKNLIEQTIRAIFHIQMEKFPADFNPQILEDDDKRMNLVLSHMRQEVFALILKHRRDKPEFEYDQLCSCHAKDKFGLKCMEKLRDELKALGWKAYIGFSDFPYSQEKNTMILYCRAKDPPPEKVDTNIRGGLASGLTYSFIHH